MVSLPVERLMLYPAVGLDKQHVHHNQSFVHMPVRIHIPTVHARVAPSPYHQSHSLWYHQACVL